MQNKKSNEKGVALLTTLILGTISLAIIGALMAFILYGKQTSSVKTRYTSALEAAKGGADIIIGKLLRDTLMCECGGGKKVCSLCADGNIGYSIYLKDTSTSLDIGDYNVKADIISKFSTATSIIYAVRVESTSNSNKPEKATIEFVLKVE